MCIGVQRRKEIRRRLMFYVSGPKKTMMVRVHSYLRGENSVVASKEANALQNQLIYYMREREKREREKRERDIDLFLKHHTWSSEFLIMAQGRKNFILSMS